LKSGVSIVFPGDIGAAHFLKRGYAGGVGLALPVGKISWLFAQREFADDGRHSPILFAQIYFLSHAAIIP